MNLSTIKIKSSRNYQLRWKYIRESGNSFWQTTCLQLRNFRSLSFPSLKFIVELLTRAAKRRKNSKKIQYSNLHAWLISIQILPWKGFRRLQMELLLLLSLHYIVLGRTLAFFILFFPEKRIIRCMYCDFDDLAIAKGKESPQRKISYYKDWNLKWIFFCIPTLFQVRLAE